MVCALLFLLERPIDKRASRTIRRNYLESALSSSLNQRETRRGIFGNSERDVFISVVRRFTVSFDIPSRACLTGLYIRSFNENKIWRTSRTIWWERAFAGTIGPAYVKIADVSLFCRASCSTSYQSPFLFAESIPEACAMFWMTAY